MRQTRLYTVAGHTFSIELPADNGIAAEMKQYEPFAIDGSDGETVFRLTVADDDSFLEGLTPTIEMNQDDDGSQIVAGNCSGKPYFEFQLWGKTAARMITNGTYTEGTAVLYDNALFGINNALMVLYALSTADKQTALFHSSVVSYKGRGYMFLGISGTGKSTHTGLWLRNIEGTQMVNDDNPVVRQTADGIKVFGSPWSGKTPCYRNVSYPLGALVQLSQAPHNAIRRLSPLEAYAALMPSISGKRWDARVADGLHRMETTIISEIPMFHLECLPDADAARVCCQAVACQS